MNKMTFWKSIPKALSDPILGLNELYNNSVNPNKINNHVYSTILGCNNFTNNSVALAFGKKYDSYSITKTQTISGTGSLKVARVH